MIYFAVQNFIFHRCKWSFFNMLRLFYRITPDFFRFRVPRKTVYKWPKLYWNNSNWWKRLSWVLFVLNIIDKLEKCHILYTAETIIRRDTKLVWSSRNFFMLKMSRMLKIKLSANRNLSDWILWKCQFLCYGVFSWSIKNSGVMKHLYFVFLIF